MLSPRVKGIEGYEGLWVLKYVWEWELSTEMWSLPVKGPRVSIFSWIGKKILHCWTKLCIGSVNTYFTNREIRLTSLQVLGRWRKKPRLKCWCSVAAFPTRRMSCKTIYYVFHLDWKCAPASVAGVLPLHLGARGNSCKIPMAINMAVRSTIAVSFSSSVR